MVEVGELISETTHIISAEIIQFNNVQNVINNQLRYFVRWSNLKKIMS